MEIVREKELKWLSDNSFDGNIKIIIGSRRVGKSTLLNQYSDFLISSSKVKSENIIKFDFNDRLTLLNTNWTKMLKQIKVLLKPNEKNVLIIDEVQQLKKFEDLLITLQADPIYKNNLLDIFVTGSDAKVLSSELSTYFVGRYLDLWLYPIEFSSLNKVLSQQNKTENNCQTTLTNFEIYKNNGGMGKIIPFYSNFEKVKLELKVLFEDILKKDIFSKIKNQAEFYSVLNYLFDNIGKEFSSLNVEKYLKANKISNISYKTINEYAKKICDCSLMIRVDYFDVKGKRILVSNPKYYSYDLGILSYKNNFQSKNYGYFLENIVLLELKSNGYEVYTYKNYQGKEVDFLAIKNGFITYFQVTKELIWKTEANNNWEREVGNISSIKDFHKKIIIC
ncbi:MAG: AAA family ATPase, partial [Mycoplasmataceae bacterium]|nr:AAA family ATPase [Mycoplasmataceae bacterium]